MLNNHMENNTQDVDLNNDSAVSESEDTSTSESTQTESNDVDWKVEYFKLKRQTKKQEVKPTQELKTESLSNEKLERLELKVEGYSDEEINAIYELGGPAKKENPIVKAALETIRTQKKSKEADTPIDGKMPVYKKYGQADLDSMSWQELEKVLPHAEN